MASPSPQTVMGSLASRPTSVLSDSRSEKRFDRQLASILEHATDVFYEKGYAAASMRDLSRASGMSLAGMYYYFESKEKLLFLIQRTTFRTIVDRLDGRLKDASGAEEKIRIFILNHLEYFLANQKAMTVLSHEDDVLTGEMGAEVAGIKREYYQLCTRILKEYQRERRAEFDVRVAVLSLFGMVNWIYTWYNPRIDGKAAQLAAQMGDIFINGLPATNGAASRRPRSGSETKSKIRNLST